MEEDSNGMIILNIHNKDPQISDETLQKINQTDQNLNLNNINTSRPQNYPKLDGNIGKGSTQNNLSDPRVINKENKNINININSAQSIVHNPVIIANNKAYGQPAVIQNRQDNSNIRNEPVNNAPRNSVKGKKRFKRKKKNKCIECFNSFIICCCLGPKSRVFI